MSNSKYDRFLSIKTNSWILGTGQAFAFLLRDCLSIRSDLLFHSPVVEAALPSLLLVWHPISLLCWHAINFPPLTPAFSSLELVPLTDII